MEQGGGSKLINRLSGSNRTSGVESEPRGVRGLGKPTGVFTVSQILCKQEVSNTIKTIIKTQNVSVRSV